ncbi:hypothetical protein L596_025385 [Steinernema carpocapsae]|uniref:Uncharacterized protein n=1 Tax=Steinernema carpocapsae TaxID=34508 RepID=A0A4U5M7M2_STECR|nr:hypothetical protein L596_025385 [Steinernema carpocapsae]
MLHLGLQQKTCNEERRGEVRWPKVMLSRRDAGTVACKRNPSSVWPGLNPSTMARLRRRGVAAHASAGCPCSERCLLLATNPCACFLLSGGSFGLTACRIRRTRGGHDMTNV